ncbi:MAG: PhzF family phenazine biosynthesis protein [Microcystaceae cyanobacterium]
MTPYKFYTLDVFSDRPFGGNPLAVFPNAEGLSTKIMQIIAGELNLSETVFVFPPETPQGTKKVRIFTPKSELPFAGHPTVGTAYLLAAINAVPFPSTEFTIILEEGVGNIPVTIRLSDNSPTYTELTVAQPPEFSSEIPTVSEIAAMLSLQPEDILTDELSSEIVSCGVPFLFVPLRNQVALERAKINQSIWDKALANKEVSEVYLFTEEVIFTQSNLSARMFAPSLGIAEDPATGSAVSALGGYLGVRDKKETETLVWTVEQGIKMGRPSFLRLEVDKQKGNIQAIRVGGSSVLMSEGNFNLPNDLI